MSVPKKTKKRIIFWSVFLGVIVVGVIILFVVMDTLINSTNRKVADSIFYANNGGVQVDEFVSAISDTMNDYEHKDKTEEATQDTAEAILSVVYEDDFISLSYCGIGTGASFPFADKQCVIFEVDNKTETTFEFSSISLALDGQDIGYAACYSKITAKSKGKIYVVADEQSNIIGKHPKEISGSMAVKDLLDADVFGEDEWWHTISFSEIAL